MTRIRQSDVGRCDFIDVLEEAVLRRRATTLQLDDGTQFTAQVVDVVTREGGDFVKLADDRELEVGRITGMERSQPA